MDASGGERRACAPRGRRSRRGVWVATPVSTVPARLLSDRYGLRYRQHLNELVSLADQRCLFQVRWGEVCAVLQAA